MEAGNPVVYGESPILVPGVHNISQLVSTFLPSTALHRYRESRLSRLPKGDISQVHLGFSMRCSWPKVMRGFVQVESHQSRVISCLGQFLITLEMIYINKLTTIFLNRLKSTAIDVIYSPFRFPKDMIGYHFPCCLVVSYIFLVPQGLGFLGDSPLTNVPSSQGTT